MIMFKWWSNKWAFLCFSSFPFCWEREVVRGENWLCLCDALSLCGYSTAGGEYDSLCTFWRNESYLCTNEMWCAYLITFICVTLCAKGFLDMNFNQAVIDKNTTFTKLPQIQNTHKIAFFVLQTLERDGQRILPSRFCGRNILCFQKIYFLFLPVVRRWIVLQFCYRVVHVVTVFT